MSYLWVQSQVETKVVVAVMLALVVVRLVEKQVLVWLVET